MTRKKLYLIFLLCYSCISSAQVDDRQRLSALLASIERVMNVHPDSVDRLIAEAAPLARKLGDLQAETQIEMRRTMHVFLTGYFDSAVAIGMKMVRVGESKPPYAELASLYYELSGIYGKNGYLDVAEKYIRKAIAIGKTLHNDTCLADGYNRLGILYERKADKDSTLLDSALICYNLSLACNERTGHILGRSYSLENIAGIYTRRKQTEKALGFMRQSLRDRLLLNDKLALSMCYVNLGETFESINDHDSAIYYGEKALAQATEISFRDLVQYSYQFLSGLYEKKGDFKKALNYHQKYAALNDSLFNETKTKQLAELNTKYETEKKEQKIKTLNQQTEIQQLQIKQRNIFLFISFGVIIIGAAMGWLAYNRRKLKAQAKLQAEINKQQEITAKEIINAEERERRRIAADLHDGVGQMLSASLMNLNGLFKKLNIDLQKEPMAEHTLSLVNESYDELRQISHQMIPNTLLKAGLASAVKDLILRIDQSKLSINLDIAGLNERMNEEVETVLYRVIQESINNVIKHAKATKLNIQLVRDEDGVSITIEDNGKGFDTKQVKDGGIGLKNMYSRIQFHKGTIDIDSAPGKGTLMVVYIPLA